MIRLKRDFLLPPLSLQYHMLRCVSTSDERADCTNVESFISLFGLLVPVPTETACNFPCSCRSFHNCAVFKLVVHGATDLFIRSLGRSWLRVELNSAEAATAAAAFALTYHGEHYLVRCVLAQGGTVVESGGSVPR